MTNDLKKQEQAPSLIELYQAKVDQGLIEEDPAQIDLLNLLEPLRHEIMASQTKTSWFSNLFKKHNQRSAIKGYYIWGEVGRGKSMLMDLFFDDLQISTKRRVHFHEFMQEVHQGIYEHRQAYKAGKTKIEDPIKPVADKLIKQASVLCFDEFVVRDIADAMILSRLFRQLFDQGLIMLATSNVAPEELYKDGLNRALFLPFLELLEEQTQTFWLDSRTDFRLEKLSKADRYISPLNSKTRKQLETLWQNIVKQSRLQSENNSPMVVKQKGRVINVPQRAGKIVRFNFKDLCEKPLGAGDYLALAAHFDTFVITDIPAMKIENRNEAKRFITLIDTLYDQHIKIIVSAAAQPDELYKATSGSEAFEFARTASRLHEMNSEEYINTSPSRA